MSSLCEKRMNALAKATNSFWLLNIFMQNTELNEIFRDVFDLKKSKQTFLLQQPTCVDSMFAVKTSLIKTEMLNPCFCSFQKTLNVLDLEY